MADDIRQWLEGLGLGEYADAFEENLVDADVLPTLTGDDLKDIDKRHPASVGLLVRVHSVLELEEPRERHDVPTRWQHTHFRLFVPGP